MQLTIIEAETLCAQAMIALGHTPGEAAIITDHLIDCELRGISYGGLARALSIADRVGQFGLSDRRIAIVKETPVSATIDGADQVGYLVADRAIDIAIGKARETGLAVVGANETWYTGMFSYYLERVTKAGFAGMIAGSGGQIVAPSGGTEGRFATNPIAFGFPTVNAPIIWDIGTSAVTLAEVILAMRTGGQLKEGLAYDADGKPTRDPGAALAGRAFSVWGGHKGSGLAMMVQLLGMLAGADAAPVGLRDCGLFALVVDPGLLTSGEDFARRASAYADSVRATRPVDPTNPVRVPFERSAAERDRRRAGGVIVVADEVAAGLRAIVATDPKTIPTTT